MAKKISVGTAKEKDTAGAVKPVRYRSPNHPVIGLEKAVERAGLLHAKYATHGILLVNACSEWKYKPNSSAANQCVAALKSYGLASVSGKGDQRKISITDMGDRIIRDAPDREKLLQEAALNPEIHKEICAHYDTTGIPHDDVLKQYLMWDRPEGQRFNKNFVDSFIKKFRETLSFANFTASGIIPPIGEDDAPKIGDYVQWTSQGVDQFFIPCEVVNISEDGEWAFVEEAQTGLPMSELTVVEPPNQYDDDPGTGTGAGTGSPPQNPLYRPPQAKTKPVIVLIGYDDDGSPIYANVTFDVPMRQGFLAKLGEQLKSMEDGAVSAKPNKK